MFCMKAHQPSIVLPSKSRLVQLRIYTCYTKTCFFLGVTCYFSRMTITTKMSSEKYINSTYSLSECILMLDFINSNTYFMFHLSKIFKIWKFRIFTKKLVFFTIAYQIILIWLYWWVIIKIHTLFCYYAIKRQISTNLIGENMFCMKAHQPSIYQAKIMLC
jgi:hypothetical protein